MGRSSSTRMALWTLLFAAASPLLVSAGDIPTGLKMVSKAGKGACWIEKLHKLPPIDEQGTSWGNCDLKMKLSDELYNKNVASMEDQLRSKGANPDDQRAMIDGMAIGVVKSQLKTALSALPSPYKACSPYIDNEDQGPAKDYSSLLKDSSAGAYPFRGLAHCILETVESQNGADQIQDLQEYWVSPKPFTQAIVDRENENRARHDTPPLKLNPELTTLAQKWADHLADVCSLDHIPKENPDSQYQGKNLGENIYQGNNDNGDADSGVSAANLWYSEIKDYPWPAFDGTNAKGVTGHFTQSVWKATTEAGYGVAAGRNGCDKKFVVGRYSPAGNMRLNGGYSLWAENVLPPNY